MKEIFKTIENYPDYKISNFGYVISYRVKRNGRLLKCGLDKNGYKHVCLRKSVGVQYTIKIHKLVAMAFLNHTPNGYKLVVDHIDNDKLNNRLDNLQLIPQRHNCIKDKKGSLPVGVVKSGNRFMARALINGKRISLGIYDTPELASNVYQKKVRNV